MLSSKEKELGVDQAVCVCVLLACKLVQPEVGKSWFTWFINKEEQTSRRLTFKCKTGMEIVHKNTYIHGSETDFLQGKKIVQGEKNLGVQKKKKYWLPAGTRSAFMHGCHPSQSLVILNTAAGCYFGEQSLVLNAVTPTRFCAMVWQRKTNVLTVLKDSPCLLLELAIMAKSSMTAAVPVSGRGSGYQLRWKWKFLKRWRRNTLAFGFGKLMSLGQHVALFATKMCRMPVVVLQPWQTISAQRNIWTSVHLCVCWLLYAFACAQSQTLLGIFSVNEHNISYHISIKMTSG